MGDIRVKLTDEGIKIWRTVDMGKGKQVRIKGSHVTVQSKSEIHADLAPFVKTLQNTKE